MFSDALRLLDEGTAQLMIDEMRKELEEKDAELERLRALLELKQNSLNGK